jgi:tetratricopeptide (TPR) repeat protein
MKLPFLCLAFFLLIPPAFTQNNRDAIWYYRTGRDLESRNRTSEADFYYNEAIRISVDEISRNTASSETYTALTWARQRQRRYRDVITWGERGLRLYADEYRIMETMGEAYFYLDDLDESLRFMQRYANSVPQGERTSVAYFFIGEIYRYKGLYRHADIAYTTAVRLEPNVALWWYRLGSVREAVGEFSQAVTAYERAIRLNPDYQEAERGLARSSR